MDLIREYIPDSPAYTPEDEPSQYDIPYVPSSPVYPTPVYNPPTPEYTPSLITAVPELDLIDRKKEENIHIRFPPDPWNDSAFTLQDKLNQLRWECLEPEPNFELYGYARYDEERKDMLIEMGRMHRCIDQMKRTLQSTSESQENFKDFMM